MLTAFHSSFFFFFLKNRGVFFQGARGAIIGFNARAFQTDATIWLAIFFKDLLENMGEIYLQGKLTAKPQTLWLELGRLGSISKSPTPPPPPARVIRGAYTGVVLDMHFLSNCSLFFWLDISLYFAQTLLRNAKLARGCRTTENFALSLAKSRGSWVWVWVNVVGKKKV